MKSEPMNTKEFNYRMIKARVAETIIKELYQECGYNVYENGMERTMPNLMKSIKNKSGKIAANIRYSPDFVIQNTKTSELHYLEVKYRKSGRFDFSSLPDNYSYTNTVFVIVSKTDIQWITYNMLKEGKYLSENSYFQLENCQIFNLPSDIVLRYKEYTKNFFQT